MNPSETLEMIMQPHKIVIVDDDPAARLTLRAALEQAGFDVLQADSGVRVLAMLRDSTQLKRTKVVFTGQDPTPDELTQTLEVGGDGFFPRPVDARALPAHLHMLLGHPPRPVVQVAAA